MESTSFQQALLDAQSHGALELDEALAFLDGFDLSTTGDQQREDRTLSPSDYNDSNSYSCRSSSFSTASSCSDELSSATPDDSLFAHLSDSAACEFSGAHWEVGSFLETLGGQLPLEPQKPLQAEPSQHSLQPPQQQQKKKTKRATRARKPAAVPKVKKPRKHNRIEILKLRELVEQLQIWHSDLQKPTIAVQGGAISASVSTAVAAQLAVWGKGASSTFITASGATAPPRSVWLELAVEQYRQRQQSEELNRKLRGAVSTQLKVANSLQSLLQKRVLPQDLDLLLETPAAATANLQNQLVKPQEHILAALYRSVESHFHETDLVCHGISVTNNVTSVFTASNTKQDAARGPTFEFTTNAPVSSNFQLLGRLMWIRSIENKELAEAQPTQTDISRDLHEKRVQMMVPSRVGDLEVDGVVVACKFEEAHRIVITIASAYTVNGSCLVFRENAWLIVSEASATNGKPAARYENGQFWELSPPPSSSALVQTLVRSYSEKQDPRSNTGSSAFTKVPDEKTAYLQEVVTKALADHMRQHMGAMQKTLLARSDSIEASMLAFKCPLAGCSC